jgi:hypothetical protein
MCDGNINRPVLATKDQKTRLTSRSSVECSNGEVEQNQLAPIGLIVLRRRVARVHSTEGVDVLKTETGTRQPCLLRI